MFVVVLFAGLLGGAEPSTVEEGFTPLFDGSTLNGWQIVRPQGPGYIARDGILVCPADGGGNLFTTEEFSDFVLRFDFKLSPGGNNGVGIRAPLEGDAAYVGMEVQLLDDSAPQYAALKPAQYCGSVYDIAAAKRGVLKPAGEWNGMQILCAGRHVRVTLNNEVIVDTNLDAVKDAATLKRHPGLANAKGHIGFLGHGSLVELKNIRVKRLPSAKP